METIVVGVIISVIGAHIVWYIISEPSGNTRNNSENGKASTAVQTDTMAGTLKLTLKAMDNWIWEFDRSTTDSLELMMGDMNSRGILEAGESRARIARFRESRLRRRTYVIDSFLVEIVRQGGDTTALRLGH